jgi:hypothetical protein
MHAPLAMTPVWVNHGSCRSCLVSDESIDDKAGEMRSAIKASACMG